MAPEQAGVTEEDQDEAPQDKDKGLFRFMRRKPAKEKRSETEWVDTLMAAAEPQQEEDEESPFMAGAAEPESEPEPGPETETYRVERQWRRRHKDEMEEIHSYIDRVIGTERDPLRRHRRLAEAGLMRHPGKRRDLASVNVEGLDEELMIAFTFPQEELRSARMVYETEGGYVIEVVRAVGGDDDKLERQHYTVSRVGSVAHALDKLRAREIERHVQEKEAREAADPTAGTSAPSRAGTDETPAQEPVQNEEPAPPVTEAGSPPEAPTAAAHEQAPGPEPGADAPQKGGGFMGGFASRFKRRDGAEEEEADPEASADAPDTGTDAEAAPATDEKAAGEDPKGGIGSFASRFKRRAKGDEPSSGDSPTPPATDAPADEEAAPQEGQKKGLFGGLPGLKKKQKDEEEADDARNE